MILVDTSVWIDFLRQRPRVVGALVSLLEQRNVLAVEAVFGELLQGARDESERSVIASYWAGLPHVDESGEWVAAGLHAGRHRWPDQGVGLIDAFLYAVARRAGARIWTFDRKLLRLLPVEMVFSSGPA